MNATSKPTNHKELYFISHSECELEQDDFVVIFKAFYEGYISKSDEYYPPRCSSITQETCSSLAGAKKITQKSRRDLSTFDFFASFLHQGKNEEAVGMTGNDIVGGTMVSGVSGGVGSMLAGGDFGQGFQSGEYSHLYNAAGGNFGFNGAVNKFVDDFNKVGKGVFLNETKFWGGVGIEGASDFLPTKKVHKGLQIAYNVYKGAGAVNRVVNEDRKLSRVVVLDHVMFFIPGYSAFQKVLSK